MTTGRRSLGSLQETDRENFIAIKLQIHDIGLYSYTCTLSMTFDFHPSAATALSMTFDFHPSAATALSMTFDFHPSAATALSMTFDFHPSAAATVKAATPL